MTWNLDVERTALEFSVRHMVISTVRGKFTDVDAELSLDPDALEAGSVRAKIAARSIQTGDGTRDDYLRGDFLSPERFPHLLFTSTHVQVRGRKMTLAGRLKIRDTERPITLTGNVRGPHVERGTRRLSFDLKGELDREDFGLTFHQTVETVSIVVGKKVSLQLGIQIYETVDV